MRRLLLFLAVPLLFTGGSPDDRALAQVVAISAPEESPAGMLTGRLDAGALFRASTILPYSTVYLDSPGGSMHVASAIAEILRDRNVTAVVPEGAACESACTLIWFGAPARGIEPGGKLGFHAPTSPVLLAPEVDAALKEDLRGIFAEAIRAVSDPFATFLDWHEAFQNEEMFLVNGAYVAEHYPELITSRVALGGG